MACIASRGRTGVQAYNKADFGGEAGLSTLPEAPSRSVVPAWA